MVLFEMIKYHSQVYPFDIPMRIEEVSAHFDITSVNTSMCRSLHTEYSYGKRSLNSKLISNFPVLVDSQKEGVPQLWKSIKWAEAFAQFIFKLVGEEAPAVIEIHPPFSDYTDMDGFVESYTVFEQMMAMVYPETEILIENRCGSIYRGGRFILSKHDDIQRLCERIETKNLKLKIAYDIPQIYTAHHAEEPYMYGRLLDMAQPLRKHIGGVHLWGKRKYPTGRKVAHCGDLNSYFEYDDAKKRMFLSAFTRCFDDGVIRKMVLEVNSGNDDLLSIIKDLRHAGVEFK